MAAGEFAAIDVISDVSGLGAELTDYAAPVHGHLDDGARGWPPARPSSVAGSTCRTVRARCPTRCRRTVSPYRPPGPSEEIVFNEQVPNGRGGVTVSVAHYKPYGGGDIYFGRADCAPTG